MQSTELCIPYRPRINDTLRVEDGLTPLSIEDSNLLLAFLAKKTNIEVFLMMYLGFATGARGGTIRTITKTGLMNAAFGATGTFLMPCGPGTGIDTKFDVNGVLQIPSKLYYKLLEYVDSENRLHRAEKANDKDKDYLFLTNRGNQYSQSTLQKLMVDLRLSLVLSGFSQFQKFHFHQTRATAITLRMKLAIKLFPDDIHIAIEEVKNFAFHKDESVTWRYINFLKITPISSRLANEFISQFLGITDADNESLLDE